MDNSLEWVLFNIVSGQTTSDAGVNREEGCLRLTRSVPNSSLPPFASLPPNVNQVRPRLYQVTFKSFDSLAYHTQRNYSSNVNFYSL